MILSTESELRKVDEAMGPEYAMAATPPSPTSLPSSLRDIFAVIINQSFAYGSFFSFASVTISFF